MRGLEFRIDTLSFMDVLRREIKGYFCNTRDDKCLGCAFTMHERICGTGFQ